MFEFFQMALDQFFHVKDDENDLDIDSDEVVQLILDQLEDE